MSTPFENPFDEYPDVHIAVPPQVAAYLKEREAIAQDAMKKISDAAKEACGDDHILKGILCQMLAQSYEALVVHEQRRIHRSN